MRLTKDEYYIDVVTALARRSTCARRKVGCILTDFNGRVLATGYNGVPRGWPHCIDHPCLGAHDESGNTTNCMAVHAEINALIQCESIDKIHSVYVSCAPCFECAKAILNTPAARIVIKDYYADSRGIKLLQEMKREIICLSNIAT